MPRRDSSLPILIGLLGLTACDQLGGSDYSYRDPTVPFEVVSRNPTPGKAGIGTTVMISVGFTAPIDPASVAEGSLTLNGASAGRFEVVSSSLKFYPAGNLLPGTSYAVQLASDLRSIDGEALGPTPTWGFKTAGAPPTPDTTLAAPRPR